MTQRPILLLIVGPIAGGKSTVARALAVRLREAGEQVALVGLDEIAEMALPTLPDWNAAHEIFRSVVGQWLRTDLTVVIAEGPGSPDEVAGVLAEVPAGTRVVIATLTSSFDIALARAQADETRGVSRDPLFLSRVFAQWARDLPRIPSDVRIDTGSSSVAESVEAIERACRGADPPHG